MTGNVVEERPSVSYAVMWVNEDGDHVAAHTGLTREEANAKADYYKHEHGFHSYPAAEDAVST